MTDPRPTPEWIRFIDPMMGPGWWHQMAGRENGVRITRCGIRLVNRGRMERRAVERPTTPVVGDFFISVADPLCDRCTGEYQEE